MPGNIAKDGIFFFDATGVNYSVRRSFHVFEGILNSRSDEVCVQSLGFKCRKRIIKKGDLLGYVYTVSRSDYQKDLSEGNQVMDINSKTLSGIAESVDCDETVDYEKT